MKIQISDTKQALGVKAAADGAELIRQAIAARGAANIIVATGASQFEMLANLIKADGIAWPRITAFHLDEYIGMPITHPASFRQYLWKRFISQLPLPLKEFHYINGEGDVAAECERLNGIIGRHPIDVAFVGIGENAHLAFNDPPADFKTDKPYVVVDLDEACRSQQFGEGWFKTMDDVPRRAVSMSCGQIMKSAAVIAAVPDSRKAAAVQKVVEGPVTPDVPSSLLQRHSRATIYLDRDSASLLKR
jgi:glucosamine-6-phosphate deaminase